ncbi:hypothetical protein M405DRAFT_811438, partial [Rhizopogon salebrosus TDB-379]
MPKLGGAAACCLADKTYARLCFETPRASGRLLETGTEDFLKLRHDGKLGNIPIIAVFTKYDGLIDRVDYELEPSVYELSDDAIKELVNKRAQTKLQEICIGPLKEFAGSDTPHVAVSNCAAQDGYNESLIHLIQTTEEHVYKHAAADASVVASVAQRVDPGLKIKASIDVKYWKALASCTGVFKDRTVEDCLRVIHTDIVAVWNFNDPHHYLSKKDFRTLVVNTVDVDVEPLATSNSTNTIKVGLSVVGAIPGILTALAAPAAPIVVPIVATVFLAKWIYEVYQASNDHLQRFISYIVDLTIILQTLYILSIRAIKLAVAAYHASPVSEDVHVRVQQYVVKSTVLDRARHGMLDEVIELVN